MNKCYLKEFQHFDGEEFITFNIYFLDKENNKITVVITNRGKITVTDYDLFEDENGLYFEYGVNYTHINLDDFEEVD